MPRWDDDEDEADEWDDDVGELDDDETIPCPYCRREIHEDSERCPHCERYLSREDAPPSRKPWWMIVGVGACLYVVYRWVFWRW